MSLREDVAVLRVQCDTDLRRHRAALSEGDSPVEICPKHLRKGGRWSSKASQTTRNRLITSPRVKAHAPNSIARQPARTGTTEGSVQSAPALPRFSRPALRECQCAEGLSMHRILSTQAGQRKRHLHLPNHSKRPAT